VPTPTPQSTSRLHVADTHPSNGVPKLSGDIRHLIPKLGLRNYWYPAIEDRTVGHRKPVKVSLLGEEICLFRGAAGDGNDHAAGHAEMDDEHAAALEMDENVLGTPRDAQDAPALDLAAQPLGQRHPQIGAVECEGSDAPPVHVQREAAADGFDFR